MALTETEKDLLIIERNEHPGIGAKAFMCLVNADGSGVSDDRVDIDRSEQKIDVAKADLLAIMTPEENAALLVYRESGTIDAKVFDEFYKASSSFTVTHSRFRETMQALNAGGIIGADTLAAVLDLGRRDVSLSEELIGRKITLEEAVEVISGE